MSKGFVVSMAIAIFVLGGVAGYVVRTTQDTRIVEVERPDFSVKTFAEIRQLADGTKLGVLGNPAGYYGRDYQFAIKGPDNVVRLSSVYAIIPDLAVASDKVPFYVARYNSHGPYWDYNGSSSRAEIAAENKLREKVGAKKIGA